MRRRYSGMLAWPQSSSGDTGLSSLRFDWGPASAHCQSACRASRHNPRWLPCVDKCQCCSLQLSSSAGIHLGSCYRSAATCDSALAV